MVRFFFLKDLFFNFRKYFSVIIVLATCQASNSQSWTRVHGLPDSWGNKVIHLQDGGYLVTGSTTAYGAPASNAFIIKTDSLGYWQWQQTFGGISTDIGYNAVQIPNGDIFIISSNYYYTNNDYGFLLTRLKPDGTIVWNTNVGSLQIKNAYSITSSGYDVVITGKIDNSLNGTGDDLFIMRVDTSGNILWSKNYGGSTRQTGLCISTLNDGGFLVGGSTTEVNDSTKVAGYVLRTDSNGDTLWTRRQSITSYQTTALYGYYGCTQLQGDSLITLVGNTRTYYSNMIATTFRMDGTLKKHFVSASLADEATDVVPTNDGGFMVAGYNSNFGTCAKAYKMSSAGDFQYSKYYYQLGGSSYYTYSFFYGLSMAPDGGFVFCGASPLFASTGQSGQGRLLIVKTGPMGDLNSVPNEIITTSDTTSFCIGDSLTLFASTSYSHYQWFWFDSKSHVHWVENSDTSSISIDSTGSYQCIMWNNNQTAYSNTLNVKVSAPPDTTIFSTGSLIHCAASDTITLSVKSQSFTTYTWFLNSTSISASNKITPLVSGSYSVNVSNVCGSLSSSPIYINTNSPPFILLDTTTVHLPYLRTAPGSCTYHTFNIKPEVGTTYAWYRNGVATGSTHATDSVNYEGYYYLTATNLCGTTTSGIVHIVYDTLNLSYNMPLSNVCDNQNLVLIAPPGGSMYTWYKKGVVIAYSFTSNLLSPHYYITGFDSAYFYCSVTFSCFGISVTGITDSVLYVNHQLTNSININGTLPVCAGGVIQIGSSLANGTYQWYKDSVLITGAVSQFFNASSSGYYTCYTTLPCGVTSSSAYIIFGVPDPAVYYVRQFYNDSAIICRTNTSATYVDLQLATTNGSGLYVSQIQWQVNGIDIPGQTNTTCHTNIAGWYKCKLYNACGFSFSDSLFVADQLLPNFQINQGGNNIYFCKGDSLILSTINDPGFIFTWEYNGDTITGVNDSSITVFNDGYYSLIVSTTAGCTSYVPGVIVRQQNIPVNNILPFTPPFICQDSVRLNANERYDYTYQWHKNGLPIAGATQKFYYATDGGGYSVQIFDSLSCSSFSEAITVVDSIVANVPITASITTEICTNDSVVLFAPAIYTSYQWLLNGNTLIGENGSFIHPTSPGNYSVVVTNASGCSGQGFYNLYIYNRPMLISQSSLPTQCNIAIGSISLTFDTNYVWLNITGPNGYALNAGGYIVNPVKIYNLNTGWYYYTYSLFNGGCAGSDSIYVNNVNSLSPVIQVSDTTACVGQTIYLSCSIPFVNYLWSAGQTNNYISVNVSGLYSLTVTDTVSGCVGHDSVLVNIAQLPATNISPSGPISICTGNSIILDAGAGNYQYQWSTGQVSQAVNTVSGGLYVVTITDIQTTCVNRDTVMVLMHPLPLISIAPSDTGYFCNSGLQLHATAGYNSYVWSNGLTDSVITVNVTGTNIVTVTDQFGCSNSDSIIVLQSASLSLSSSIIYPSCPNCCDGWVTVTPINGIAPFTYNWNNGQTTPTATGLCNGTYVATVTDANGCIDSISTMLSVGIDEKVNEAVFRIFPNPVKNILNLEGRTNASENLILKLVDTFGREILTTSVQTKSDFKTSVNMSPFANGVYFLEVVGYKATYIFKVVKN